MNNLFVDVSPAWIIDVVTERFSVGLRFLHRVSASGLYVIGNVFRSLINGLQRASRTAVKSPS